MRAYVPTVNRAKGFLDLTARALADPVPVVDGRIQERLYRKAGWQGEIVVNPRKGPVKCGKATAINHVLRSVEPRDGRWVLFADDDIRAVTGLAPGAELMADESTAASKAAMQAHNRKALAHRLSHDEFDTVLEECMAKAESVGASLIGFAPYDNPMFRLKKWSECSFVVGDMFLVRNDGRLVPERHIEDLYLLAERLCEDGCVLVNRHVRPDARHWQAGGHGERASRRAVRAAECEDLARRYPGLFQTRKGFAGDAGMMNVSLRVHNREQLRKWLDSNPLKP